MNWTKEVPQYLGSYWWKDENGGMCKVRLGKGWRDLILWYRDPFGWVPVPNYGEWSGPIEEPKEQP